MPKKKSNGEKKKRFMLTPERAQMIAKVIIRGDRTLKQIASDFGCTYTMVYRVLREYVNVEKVLTLRYPELDAQEPVNGNLYSGLVSYLDKK